MSYRDTETALRARIAQLEDENERLREGRQTKKPPKPPWTQRVLKVLGKRLFSYRVDGYVFLGLTSLVLAVFSAMYVTVKTENAEAAAAKAACGMHTLPGHVVVAGGYVDGRLHCRLRPVKALRKKLVLEVQQ